MIKQSKIAFVMPWHISERGGGAEVQANYLSQELAERGFQIYYICQTANSKKANTVEVIGKVTIYWLKSSGRFPWMDQNKYLKPLKAIRPDYILQRLSSNVTYVLGKYRSKNNCKLIWFCTDNKNPYRTFHFSKFKERSSLKSLGVLKYIVFGFNNTMMDYYRNKGMEKVDIAFHQNNIQKNLIKNHFNLDSFLMISGHPIPKEQIAISQHFNNKNILWCANFGKHKRPELFVELASKMQHTDYRFVMVGGHNNTSYVNKLLFDKPKNLVATGRLNFNEALSYFDKATLFVNTSTPGGDGFPNTFIQAWLRSVPVLSFGFDPDQVVVTNNLGYTVSALDEAVAKLSKLLHNEQEYNKISNNAFNYALKHHSIDRMTDNFLNIVETEL